MRVTPAALILTSLLMAPVSAFAEEQPASKDGKSVPMQEAPSKIDTGKSKAHSDKDDKGAPTSEKKM